MHAWLVGIAAHPALVLIVVFGVACAESLAIVGTLVPAGIVMFAAGALIGAGVLEVWATLAVAALGAMTGDGVSFELGRRYAGEVRTWWAEKGHAEAWERGEQFVDKHGGKSIVMARFFAPVRAVVPLVAGAAQMPRHKFYPINVASALAWSPAHIVPGIVFGASAQLAAAVSERLAVMLLLFAALIWLIVRFVRVAMRYGVPVARTAAWRAMERLGRRHPSVATALSGIVGPDHPESPTLMVLALLFIGSVWLFLGILQDVIAHDPLMEADIAIDNFLRTLHTVPVDYLMTSVVALSGWDVGLIVSALVLLWLVVRQCWRTAIYWLLAVCVAAAVSPVLEPSDYVKPLAWPAGVPHAPSPSGNATLNLLLYGSLGWLLIRRWAWPWRGAVAAGIVGWIALVGFAHLYLGENWLADVLAGWSLGLAWFAVLAGIHAHWNVRDDVRPGILVCVVAATLAIYGVWANLDGDQSDLDRSHLVAHETTLTLRQWREGGWRSLPGRRIDLSGDREEALPLQWADDSTSISAQLEAAGWRPAPAWSVQSALLWLTPRVSVSALPVLPKLSNGYGAALTFVKIDPARPLNRTVLRLWRSDYEVAAGGASGMPVWYGALYPEIFRRPWQLLTVGVTTRSDTAVIPGFAKTDAAVSSVEAGGSGATAPVTLVSPRGVPVVGR
ncbi:TPA: VTT domain-containing protein [Burkholderia aenigmatica]|uniref:bifunctional DedA family/phosphatase PAP2 family protein n=1 Tax=Burkholderia sp. AU45251 TaxID=3059204 RepID=UPI0026534BA7|nr:bifunctional DedA family/phosphatase PAP2 family protein [Burkholderia sp. AU45251]HDR9482334.1 VTT domain-containing protein [Burkholderia aenigmatica]MDN7515026.1 VTT domain-containing protein [Burkholderia sp. AU45251]HDR9514640.1 VTT domain-containing protein [Burkholderia aenigmatica]HDR9590705.1 VTT domain-containing protein [Burkholderia aenigmatica]HDR9599861.1 VTT domain-containing protein [Burkholderia aenigmatica]